MLNSRSLSIDPPRLKNNPTGTHHFPDLQRVLHAFRHSLLVTRFYGWFVGAFLVSTIAVLGAWGQGAQRVSALGDTAHPEVRIEIIGGDSLAVDPGSVVTVVYRIAAQQDTASNLTPHFDIPNNWSIVFGSQLVELADDKPVTRFVTYKVPEVERAGSYTPSLRLHDDAGLEVGRAVSTVVVNSIHNLALETGPVPPYLAAGRAFDVPLKVVNDGNATIRVTLNRPTHKVASIELSDESISLEPGELKEITASVTTDADAQRAQRIIIRFDAHVEDVPEIRANTSISFDLVPVFAKMRPKAANTPLSLSLETIGDESGASPQASIHASGKLLGGDVRVAAVLAETPRRRLYGQEAQVTVQYARNNLAVTVGDHSASTSPMTLTGERGVGIATAYQGEGWRVKTSVQRSRTIIPVQKRAAISADYQASERTTYSANLLHRNEFYSGTLFTARMLTQPFGETSRLDVECGVSNGRLLQDPSCMLQTRGSTSRFSYQLRAQRASIDFPGTMAGNRMISAFTSLRLSPTVRLEQTSTTMRRRIGNGADRSNLYAKAGFNYSKRIRGGNLYATVHGIHTQARYTLLEGTTERIENILRVTTGYHKRTIGLTVTGEQGSASADGLGKTSSLSRYRVNGRYRVFPFLHLNGSMELSQGNLSSTSADQTNQQYGLGATFAMRSDLQATITGFRSTIQSRLTQQYASLRAGASKSFKSGHVLSVRAQFNENSGRQTLRTADYRIAFTTPLDMPFAGRRGSDNVLEGRVIDAETGAPVADALLFLGNDLAITDEKGRFRFARPDQDITFLRVDASSIGYDRTPAIPMPMEINAEQFNGSKLVIPIARASMIRGVIEVYSNADNGAHLVGAKESELQLTGGHNGAVVQVENESIRQRTRTDRSGSFAFPQLPPGKYTVSVVRANLSDSQQLESRSLQVTLEARGELSLVFKVVPVRKQIRMIKSTNLSLSPSGTLSPSDTSDKSVETGTSLPFNGKDGSRSTNGSSSRVDALSSISSTKSATSAGWLGSLKQTSRARKSGEKQRDAAIIPFYLERGMPEPSPSHPAYPFLFVLCILFLLVDLDLLVRSLIEKRTNRTQLLKAPVWMRTVRFLALYAFAIITATWTAGILAGLAVSLALSGLSVAIESRPTYRAILNITMLHFVAGVREGLWVRYRQTAVQIVDISLESTEIRHVNGIEESIPTHGLHNHISIFGRNGIVYATDHELTFSRLSNLRMIRSMVESRLEAFRPSGLTSFLEIRFEDENAEWTVLHARIITDVSSKDACLISELIEAELIAANIPLKRVNATVASVHTLVQASRPSDKPTSSHGLERIEASSEPAPHLRLIKGGNQKAA